MSLVRIAVRICLVEALKGATDVGDNVLNSQIGALEAGADGALKTDQEKRFISVYTDAAAVSAGDVATRVFGENGSTEILIEFGIASTMTVKDPETGVDEIWPGVPGTDAIFETVLDLLARQIGRALSDPANRWAEIFRGLAFRFTRIERQRTSSEDKGLRLAGQQIKITADLINDPETDEDLEEGSPFAAFLMAAEESGNPVYAVLAARIRALISGVTEEWEDLQRRHGLTRAELLAIGLGPLEQDVDGEAPELQSVTIEADGYSPTTSVTPDV